MDKELDRIARNLEGWLSQTSIHGVSDSKKMDVLMQSFADLCRALKSSKEQSHEAE